MDNAFSIRRARREDCPGILELIRELAAYERAPAEVTVALSHFEESGFGERPVWWAFVACVPDAQEQAAVSEQEAETPAATAIQDPLLRSLMQEAPQTAAEEQESVQQPTGSFLTEQGMQLEESVTTSIPEQVLGAMPLMQPASACEKLVGFALYYIRYSTWKGQRMYLEDLIVTESWRGKGVGTALMDALIGAARAEGFHGISWQVLEWNEAAIQFYGRYNARFDAEWINGTMDV